MRDNRAETDRRATPLDPARPRPIPHADAAPEEFSVLAAAFTPSTTAVAGSLPLSALFGLLPLALFFVMLGVFKIATHWRALGSLAVALLIAAFGFKMPLGLAALAPTQGLTFGLLVICYIVVAAVWLYNLSEASGRGDDVRAVFSAVGKGDIRIQALLIATAFCALMEGLAGFGAPVAITCAMLLALGLEPIKAALVTMVANSLHVAFGAMAIPMITTAKLGVAETTQLTSTGSNITPLFLIWLPLLLAMLDGARGVKQLWPVGLTAGFAMAFGHWATAHFVSFELTAVVGAPVAFALVAGPLAVWTPTTPEDERSAVATEELGAGRIALALLPYWFVVIIFAIAKLWRFGVDLPAALKATDLKIPWPGLDGRLLTPAGEVSGDTVLSISTLASPGTMLILASLVVTIVYSVNSSGGRFPFSMSKGIAPLGRTVIGLRMAILTISAVIALAYTMNFSGQTVSIGTALAATGTTFAFFAPVLGWIGTAVTGSATSAGARFASLHSAVATQTGLSPQLLLSVNEIGGGIGKIVSPQNLAIAATAVKREGLEPELLRRTAPYSIGLLLLLSIITTLASVGVLGFIIAG